MAYQEQGVSIMFCEINNDYFVLKLSIGQDVITLSQSVSEKL